MSKEKNINKKVKIKDNVFSYLLKEFEKPIEIGNYYGFIPIHAPRIGKEDILHTKDLEITNLEDIKKQKDKILFQPEEKIAFLRMYLEENFSAISHPLLVSYKKNEHPCNRKSINKKCDEFSFHIVGIHSGSAEAILIKNSLAILSDLGYSNLSVEINSIGDKESIADFERQLMSFLRKNIESIPSDLHKVFKKDVFEILKCKDERCKDIQENLPKSIGSLSSEGRAHFKEVLEYLEMMDIPYKINNELIGNKNYCSQTIFAIKQEKDGGEKQDTLAIGYRYSRLTKKLGFKKEVPTVTTTIFIEKKDDNKNKKLTKQLKKPKFYLVQLGFDAKLHVLNIVETLRKARIPIYHFINKDKITAQLANAENLKVPYLLIIGQKEAMENAVVVRNISTREQETVYIKDLVQYLKKLKS